MTAVIVAPGGGYRALAIEPRRARARQLLQLARRRRVRAAVPARTAVSPSDRARRRAARDPHGARARGGMAHRAGSHRHHGLLGRRPSRVDARRRISIAATRARPIRSIASSSRPDFAILGYPVISLIEPWTHQGSKTNLLGDAPDPALARSLSSETQVTAGDAADVHLPDQRGHDRAGGEQRSATTSRCERLACRPRCTSSRTDAHGSGLGMTDPALVGMAEAARELDARQRVPEVAMIAPVFCVRQMSVR